MLGVTTESGIVNTKSPSAEYLAEIKLEPDNFVDSMVDNVHEFGENLSGSY